MIGQTGSMPLMVDGTLVPSGTTLFSPSVLETGSQPTWVFLARGKILRLAKDTRAYLGTTSPNGELEIVVESGAVAVQNGMRDSVMAVAGERLVSVRPGVQVAQLDGRGAAIALLFVKTAATKTNCSLEKGLKTTT